jgi:RNA polymerase sigma-70 factor (ECF subfamily)
LSRELVERAMHGDRDAFGIIAERRLARLTGTAGLILRDADAADDAAQETLVRAWRDLPGLRDPDRFDPWLHRILVRACGDHLRRRGRDTARRSDAIPDMAGADEAARHADRDEMDRALDRLSVEQRTAVVLHYYLGLSHPEIAGATGQPIGTVKSRLSRALDHLQAALAADARVGAPREGST